MPFKKGQSGHPGGRPKTLGQVQDIARKHEVEAIETLVAIMRNDPDSRVRAMAADKILDRARGKPAQAITGEGGEGPVQHVLKVIRNAK